MYNLFWFWHSFHIADRRDSSLCRVLFQICFRRLSFKKVFSRFYLPLGGAFQNIFINWIKRSLVEKETKGGVRASKKVEALLLPTTIFFAGSWLSASLSYSSEKLTRELIWGLRCLWDSKAIVKDRNLNVILSIGLADLLSIEFLEL